MYPASDSDKSLHSVPVLNLPRPAHSLEWKTVSKAGYLRLDLPGGQTGNGFWQDGQIFSMGIVGFCGMKIVYHKSLVLSMPFN